jgi:hypothetical protein
LFGDLAKLGHQISPGDLGENITTSGLQLERLPLGTLLRLGPFAAVELTGLRTPCVLLDRFQTGLKKLLLNKGPPYKCGVMGIVRTGGPLRAGDKIWVFLPDGNQARLPLCSGAALERDGLGCWLSASGPSQAPQDECYQVRFPMEPQQCPSIADSETTDTRRVGGARRPLS